MATTYPPLTGSARVLGTLALSLATFMNVLDTSIANVSLSAISGDLGVSPVQGTWVITSFAVANAIGVPLTGWLTQRVGQVRLFIASVLLFVICSWLCGMSPNMTMLITFRALQGLVAGPMVPLAQTLLLSSYPREKSGLAMSMWSITTLVAPVTGPMLGGWITDNMSWSWIFFINVPVGIVAALMVWSIYHKRESETRRIPIDTVGLALLVIFIGSMQIMLDKGKELDWFSSPLIMTLAVVAVVGFALFLVWELTDQHPVVDLSLFKERNFWLGSVTMALAYGLFFANVVIMPLWLQQYMGYTATQAGMVMAQVGLFAIVLSPLVGLSVNRFDPRLYTTISFFVFALVLWMRSHFTVGADFRAISEPTIIQGIATAFFFIPLVTITLSDIEPTRLPAATGLSNFMRITMGAVGTSISSTMWEDRGAMHHAQLTEAVQPGNLQAMQAIDGLQKLGMSHEQALATINSLATQQGIMISTQEIFYGSALLFLGLTVLVWFTRRVHGRGPGAGAGAH